MRPKLRRELEIHVIRPGLGFQVLTGGFRGRSGEEVVFGEGDDVFVPMWRDVGVDDFEVVRRAVVEESVAVAGFCRGDDGGGEAPGVEGLVDADEHKGVEVKEGQGGDV